MEKASWHALIIKALAAIFLAALVWELVLSVTLLRRPDVVRDGPYGTAYAPGGLMLVGTEGYAWNRFDSLGFNNSEESLNAPDSPIVVLGDSFTEALQLPRERNFCSLVEAETGVPVINLGFSGNSAADWLMNAEAVRDDFDPGVVVIVFTNSDFLDDATEDSKAVYIAPTQDGFKLVKTEGSGRRLRVLKDRAISLSSLMGRSYLRMRELSAAPPGKRPFFSARPVFSWRAEGDAVGPVQSVPLTELTADQKRLVRWELSEFRRIFGDRLRLLYVDRAHSLTSMGVVQRQPGPLTQELDSLCEEFQIPLATTQAGFTEYFEKTGQLPYGFQNYIPGLGHLNHQGHRLVAEALVELLSTDR